jgi:hypothetical protein
VGFITRKAQAEVPSDILGNLLLVSSTEHDRLTHAKNLLLFSSLARRALCHFERMIPGTSHFQKFKI